MAFGLWIQPQEPRGLPGSLHLGLNLCFLDHLMWSLFWIFKGSCFLEGGWIFLPEAHAFLSRVWEQWHPGRGSRERCMTDGAVAGPGPGATLGRCRMGWMRAPWAAAPTPRVTIAVPTRYLCVLATTGPDSSLAMANSRTLKTGLHFIIHLVVKPALPWCAVAQGLPLCVSASGSVRGHHVWISLSSETPWLQGAGFSGCTTAPASSFWSVNPSF